MTGVRQLPLSRLGHLVPPLVDDAALVALVTMANDPPWAAKAAWDIARIAARDGRRVALVDLCLENPALHEMVGLHATEGIVDAFEYGVSLNKAAHEVTGVFIIPAGSETAHPDEVYAHARWPKLQAGFRSEGALLLALLPLTGLAQLSAAPDGALVLAPEGVGPEFALPRDVPLLGVVRDRWLPSSPRVSPPSMTVPVTDRRRRGLRIALAALVVAALAVGGWALLARARESGFLVPPPLPAPAPAPAPAHSSPLPAPTHATIAKADTLGWTIQLAAYARLDKALALADRLTADGVTPFVTPVALDDRGRGSAVWYRVLAGAFPTRDSAVGARAGMWKHGLAARGQGDVLRAPYSFSLSDGAPAPSRLRARGIPVVPWGSGSRLLAGAFETPEQASLFEARLKRAGVQARLVTRMGEGTTP